MYRVVVTGAVLAAGVVAALGLLAFGTPARPSAAGATIAGDVDCDTGVDAVDALMVLRWVAELPVSQTQPCTPIGTGAPYLQGDVDCSGNVDAVDALMILRWVAGLPVTQAGTCPPIGSDLPGTATPSPTTSPMPTATPTATPTAAPTPTPTSTATPTPATTSTPTPTPTATPTPTPTPTPPTTTPSPTLGPEGWLPCAYATDWNGGDDTARVCTDGGEEYPESLLEATSCDAYPTHGASALWNIEAVPPGGLGLRLRLDMRADAGAFACVRASNHIVTYEITLSTTEKSYYVDLPPITAAGPYQVWVEFRGAAAAGRYGWLDFAALQAPVLGPTPTP